MYADVEKGFGLWMRWLEMSGIHH